MYVDINDNCSFTEFWLPSSNQEIKLWNAGDINKKYIDPVKTLELFSRAVLGKNPMLLAKGKFLVYSENMYEGT